MREDLQRWCGWFFLGNIIFIWLLGLNYFRTFACFETQLIPNIKIVLPLFTSLAFLGQLGLLLLIPRIFLGVVIYFFPQRFLIFIASVSIATVAALLILLDIFIFNLYRFHLNFQIMSFILQAWNKPIFDFSSREILFSCLLPIVIILLEISYAFFLWRRRKQLFSGITKWLTLGLIFCIYYSYMLIGYSANNVASRFMLDAARALPLYSNVFAILVPFKNARAGLEHMGQYFTNQFQQTNGQLNYPLHPIQYSQTKPLNLLVIMVDSWRFDALNSEAMPYVFQFSKKAWRFAQHVSGGNATGPGIFSFFYGIPSTYWGAMELNQRAPELLLALQKQKYKMGIFSSNTLRTPSLDQTVFSSVPNLETDQQVGDSPYTRDLVVTAKFQHFIKTSTEPFFSFLLFHTAHGNCAVKEALEPFKPVITVCDRMHLVKPTDPLPYYNRYKNALLLVDQQINQVIESLQAQHLLANTVVIITGDHGEEYNDNHQGYWHHASNFTRYQLATPLIVYWPGQAPQVFTHQTTHFDVVPTLMRRLLGSKNPITDYSVGQDLLNPKARPYFIAGSYINYGIVEKDQITVVSPSGDFEVQGPNAVPKPQAKVNFPLLQSVLADLKKYYK